MNYYEILGVKRNASNDELKKAYKQLVKKYHPDLYSGDKSFAEQKTKEINVAYDVLSDSTKRSAYDEEIFPSPSSYSYTPPKYDSAPNDYYRRQYEEKIKNNYQREYNYNDYVAAYRAARRKAAAENAAKYRSDNYSNELYRKFNNMKTTTKVFFVVLIAIFYGILMIENIVNTNYSSFKYSEPVQRTKTNTTIKSNFYDKYYDDTANKNFDIHDYLVNERHYTKRTLQKLYNEKYYKTYSTYDEFLEMFTIYVRDNNYIKSHR